MVAGNQPTIAKGEDLVALASWSEAAREVMMASVLMVRCKNPACGRLFQSLLQFDPPSFAGVHFEARRYRCPRCRETHPYTRADHSHVDYLQRSA